MDEAEINSQVAELEARAADLDEQATRFEVDRDLRDRSDQLRAEATVLRKEMGYRYLEGLRQLGDDPYAIMANRYTDSFLYKMISTPMKRALQSKYPTQVKERFVRLANDAGVALALNSVGKAAPPSVYQKAAVSLGELARINDDLIKLWASETNASQASMLDLNLSDVARKITRQNDTFENWLDRVNTKRLKGNKNLTDSELSAVKRINEYFEAKGRMLEDVGLIRSQKGLSARVEAMTAEIEDLKAKLAATKKPAASSLISARINDLDRQLKADTEALAVASDISNPESFYPRFWDHGAIRSNRQQFSDVLVNWYRKNPFVDDVVSGQPTRVKLSTDPAELRKRAEDTIDTILGEKDPTNIDNIGVGYGRSKHFRHRKLDIPNGLVTDFIVTDPLAAMKTYAARIEPRYHFQKDFGKDFRGALFDMELDMVEAGSNPAEINAMRRDFVGLYDQIAGAVIRNPDALSQKVAFFLREAASFAYMGGAGLASIPDFGRIVMQHELGNVFKGIRGMLDKERVNLAVDEVRYAGAALDIFLNSAHMRITEDLGNNMQANGLLNSARNAFYIVNGLAPLTTLAKQLAGIVDSHTIIDYSIKLSQGKLDDQSRTWLARHGIDEEFASLIARAPWEKNTDGLYMANTDNWADSIYIPEIEGKRVTVIEQNEDGTPVGKTRNGRYIPAFYRNGVIRFDRDYIEGPMFDERAWLDPKVEGVDALPDIFKTPKQWSNFVMLHEINHSRFSAEDLGFVKRQSEEIVINNAPVGMSRQEIIDNLESGVDNPNLVFHVTNQPQSIINDGFLSGGTVRGTAILDSGYGDYITVFDIRDIVDKVKSNQEILDTFQITEDQVDRFLAQKMYGDSAFLSKRSVDGSDFKDFNLLNGQKPVAVIHISELPQFRSQRFEGDRADELGDATGLFTAEDTMIRDYRSGVLSKDSYEDYSIPQSYWGLSWDEISEELDRIIELENTFADIGKNYNPFEERVSRPSTVVNKAAYENRINQLALEDYRAAQTLNEETVLRFRSALNSGVLNQIMTATPADKPLIVQGVAYIPMSIGSRFGMREDSIVKGYARVENGFLGLPFQFYNFLLASVNKTVAALAHGQVKNRALGSAVMLGLGYMVVNTRTPDRIWDEMSVQDKFARSLDMSGLGSIYSDLFYTSLHTSLALAGPNITAGLISPKFKTEPNVADAVAGLAGAGPSWGLDMVNSLGLFLSGDYGEGAKEFVRNLPGSNLWFIKDELNQISRGWAN